MDILFELFGRPERKELGYKIRQHIVEEAAKSKLDLIVTGVVLNHNKFLYQSFIDVYKNNGGVAFVVWVKASRNTLLQRVEDESRKNKFNKRQDLEEFFNKYPDSLEKWNVENQIEIDTTKMSPAQAAQKIKEHFNLL